MWDDKVLILRKNEKPRRYLVDYVFNSKIARKTISLICRKIQDEIDWKNPINRRQFGEDHDSDILQWYSK